MKWYGMVSYSEQVETAPGVWSEIITERPYYGDVIRNFRKLETAGINDNVNVSNDISIVADPFARENFHAIRYVTFMDVKWKVGSVEVQYPRLLLSLGGVYNAESEI